MPNNPIKKRLFAIIFVFLATSVATPSFAATRSTSAPSAERLRVCERVIQSAERIDQRLFEFQKNVALWQDRRLEKLDANWERTESERNDLRALHDAERKKLYSTLEREAATPIETAAVDRFKESFDAAIEAYRSTIDLAAETYHTDLAALIKSDQREVDFIVDQLRDDISNSYSDSKNDCVNGVMPSEEIKDSINAQVLRARDRFQTALARRTKFEDATYPIRQQRIETITTAAELLLIQKTAARTQLKKALRSVVIEDIGIE